LSEGEYRLWPETIDTDLKLDPVAEGGLEPGCCGVGVRCSDCIRGCIGWCVDDDRELEVAADEGRLGNVVRRWVI
jgi:hypothetical protein